MKTTKPVTLALASCILFSTPVIQAEEQEIPVPKAILAAAFNTVLDSMMVNIDTYGSRKGNSWYHNNSYVVTPDGKKRPIKLEEIVVHLKTKNKKKTLRTWRAYINDFRSQSLSVVPVGAKLRLNVVFESAGEEIKIKCINAFKKQCIKMERDGEIDNATLSIDFAPTVMNNSITYKPNPKVSFEADIQLNNKLCKIGGDLCNKIFKYRSKIRKAVTARLTGALNGYRATVAKAVRQKLAPYVKPEWTIKSIKSNGSNFILVVSYPDPINQNTVSIKSFKVLKQSAVTKCPAKVRFKATIHSKYAIKNGKVWLENENGKKTKAVTWKIGKNGTATSEITRPWTADDFKKHTGWSRLVLRYSDHKGKTFTRKSKKVSFSRTCQKSIGTTLKKLPGPSR